MPIGLSLTPLKPRGTRRAAVVDVLAAQKVNFLAVAHKVSGQRVVVGTTPRSEPVPLVDDVFAESAGC